MDNVNSQPALQLPIVPADFETRSGSSRVDFANALFELLKGALVTGIVQAQPSPYDIGAMQASITELQVRIEEVAAPKQRSIIMNGVNNGLVIVPFDDIGTTDYAVDLAFITPNVNINTVTWSIIDGSKQNAQVQLRIDGSAATYKIHVNILERKN